MVSNAAFEKAVLDALSDLRAEMGSMKAEMGSMKAEIGSMKAEIAGLGARLTSLENVVFTQYTNTTREIRELRSDMGHRLLNLDTRVGSLELDVTMLAQSAIAKLREHDQRISALEP